MSSTSYRNSYDVAVVGGGPAGSSAASLLARQGLNVALLEKASLPRYKACGGGVVGRAIQLLPIDIDVREVIECECHTVNVNLLDAHLHFSAKRDEPIILMTMRENFDSLLVSEAEDAGADLRSKCQVFDFVTAVDRVELATSQGPVQARFVIAADGATSIMARKAGWHKHQSIFTGLEYEVIVCEDELRKFSGVARFDLGFVPYGYAWVFPKKDHLSIGVGDMRYGHIHLRQKMEQYFPIIGLNKIERIERHGFFIPVSPRKGGFVKGRVILTGDAAGFVDPLSGEGITHAIKSGQTAAKALIEGNLNTDQVMEAYNSEIKKGILPELRLGRILAKLIYTHPRIRTFLFRFRGQGFVEDVVDMNLGKISYLRLLLNLLNGFREFNLGSRS